MSVEHDPADLCQSLEGDGCIPAGSEIGNVLGFTSDKFDGWLWKKGGEIMISFIESKDQGKGNVRALMDRLELVWGVTVAVPTPLGRMQRILEARGFKPTLEETELGICEIWRRPTPQVGGKTVGRTP